MEKLLHGFELVDSRKIPEVDGEGFEFIHQKTKARLAFLKTSDQNKAFAIGFRTTPLESTGVPHILEHSVLCGSEKFTAKDPFTELSKGSLNTFLNAFTYPDKTMYPFATQNLEDYKNILAVYMDAVFNPKMQTVKEIFLQEGWHYEIEKEEDPLVVNGVVFNEMKGAYSTPEDVLDYEVTKVLFDNTYKYSSGGDPDVMPELTYEHFIEFYKKYYHPSNCCIYIYGDIDAAEIMEFIDREYLSKYDYKKIDSEIGKTKPFEQEKKVKGVYSIGKEDNPEGKTYAEICYVVEDAIDSKVATSLDVIASALFNSDSAYIKNKILDAGLCQDLMCYVDTHKLQPTFCIMIQNTTEENAEKIFNIIEETLADLVKNGVDKKLINSCIMNNEFAAKEFIAVRAGRGVNMASSVFARYFYDRNPFEELEINGQYAYARELNETDGFEKLIKKSFLDNQFRVKFILNPENGLADKKAEETAKKLAEYKKSLSAEEIQNLLEENKKLRVFQTAPDTPEAKSTVPSLKVSDIEKKVEHLELKETKGENYKLYHFDAETNGIAYARILTDAGVLTSEEVPYLGFIANALSLLPTEKYDISELSNEIMENIGEVRFLANAIADSKNSDKTNKFFEINFKAVKEKLPKAVELIEEILFKSDFRSKGRIKQVLNMILNRMEGEMISEGHTYGIMRVGANVSPTKRFIENSKYFTYYQMVKSVADDFDNKSDEFIAKCESVLNKVLNSNNTLVSVAGNSEIKDIFEKEISKLCAMFKPVECGKCEEFKKTHLNEGIMTTSNVQYVSMGYSLKDFGAEHTGKMDVLQTIVSNDYAWIQIRVLNGAYGAPFRVDNEVIVFSSYRDPHLNNSLNVYRGAGEYIKNLKLTEQEFNNYIIGTIASLDMPKTAEQKCAIALNNLIANVSDEDRQKRRDEVLSAKLSEINELGDLLTKITDKNLYVVFGNESKVKENEKIFDEIKMGK